MTDPAIPTQGAFTDGVHRMTVRVYYEDTDTAGIVYYANYLRYTERARTEILRLLGVDQYELMTLPPEERVSFAVRRCEVDYLLPARLDDIITVETRLEDIKAASMWMAQDIYRGDDHLIHSRIQAACMNHKGAPTRMPKDFVQQARAYLPLNQSATA